MTQTKSICLLGFSKQAEQTIKKQLAQQCAGYDLVWVSANAKELSAVIINVMFLDTPQIEKYVSTVTVPCVSIYTQASGQAIAEKHGIASTPLQEHAAFSDEWLAILLGNESKRSRVKIENEQSSVIAPQGNVSTDYVEFIKTIKERRPVNLMATCGKKTVYLTPSEQSAYINFARDDIPGIENWQWQQIDRTPPTEGMRRINIDQWLFETIWQSQTEKFTIDSTKFYKLIRWPQPFSQHRRSEALRLAAQIKFHPVKVSDLVEKTQFSYELIEQFLYATNQAGQIEIVAPTKEILLENERIDTPRKDPDRETKKSFIGRLRAKLGL